MRDPGDARTFGCALCWPETAETARAASRSLAWEADLVDESHYHVMLETCRDCGQRFVSVFTELVDWADGDDPQAWALLPLTADEAAALRSTGAPAESDLTALGRGRRSLRHDAPKGAPTRTYWATGLAVGPHD